jgi:hypothetical protein
MKEYENLSEKERGDLYKQFLQDPNSFYEKAEADKMKRNLQQSYKERFLTMTSLMKMNLMFSKAKISATKLSSNTND